jgi:hypothetical protein
MGGSPCRGATASGRGRKCSGGGDVVFRDLDREAGAQQGGWRGGVRLAGAARGGRGGEAGGVVVLLLAVHLDLLVL